MKKFRTKLCFSLVVPKKLTTKFLVSIFKCFCCFFSLPKNQTFKTRKKKKKKKKKKMLRRGLLQQRLTSFSSSKSTLSSSTSSSSIVAVVAPRASNAARTYVSPCDPFCAIFMCAWVGATFGAWGNQFFALSKYGIYRTHQMQVDGSILPEYNRCAQFIGTCFGVLFYWFIVGPMKYRHSDIEKWSKRVGPF